MGYQGLNLYLSLSPLAQLNGWCTIRDKFTHGSCYSSEYIYQVFRGGYGDLERRNFENADVLAHYGKEYLQITLISLFCVKHTACDSILPGFPRQWELASASPQACLPPHTSSKRSRHCCCHRAFRQYLAIDVVNVNV